MAHYLPQYHPIPENSEWWGPGFTEWTNVAKAKPLFPGHIQPNIPADLGFYDLRLPELREQQACLAQSHGIEGFVYWHYWFGAGKRLLERPFKEVVKSKSPDFPFCLAWANQSWSGVWHGCPNRILIEQTYPGLVDAEEHFYTLLDAFLDERYIKINGKNLFAIFCPEDLKNANNFIDRWRELARAESAPDFYFLAIQNHSWSRRSADFDGFTTNPPCAFRQFQNRIKRINFNGKAYQLKPEGPYVLSYEEYVKKVSSAPFWEDRNYPCVVPNWDNTPRTKKNGFVYLGSTPSLYKRHLQEAVDLVSSRPADERIVFIKSWNEWAEGNYLEPDLLHGRDYLKATLDVVKS